MVLSEHERAMPTVLGDAGLRELRGRLIGPLVLPQDPDYDDVRRVFNAMIDRHPAVIARCATTDDVVTSLAFARSRDLSVSVRGGGHGVAGHCVSDGGLMIDLSLMKGIAVDPDRRVATAQPGLRLGEFVVATERYGLVSPTGTVSDTGLAGLTLGGGYGWLNGMYGMAVDNLVGAEVVTADGRVLRVSEDEHPDLFWALKGGGGNFGVVTSFEYRLHPVGPTVYGGGVAFAPEHRRAVLELSLIHI